MSTRKIVTALIAAGASLGVVAPAVAQERPLKEFTPQFSAPSAHSELKHPAPRDLANPPMAAQGTKTTQAVVLGGAVRWNTWNDECYKAGKLTVPSGYDRLDFQKDGNLVAYKSSYSDYVWHVRPRAAWNTRTMGADRICFQSDSNVVIYRGSKAMWQSGKQLNMTGDRIREVAFGWPQFTDRTQLEYRSWGRVLKTWKFAK